MRQGSFLIEAMVGITLVVVGLLGIISLLVRSAGLNQNVYNRFIAANLAAEGIEVVKNVIDINVAQSRPWNDGINDGYYKLSHNCAILNEGSAGCAGIGGLNEGFETVMQRPPLFLLNNDGLYNYSSGGTTVFKRLVRVQNVSADEIRVNSFVRWQDRGLTSTINVEDLFFNWRP